MIWGVGGRAQLGEEEEDNSWEENKAEGIERRTRLWEESAARQRASKFCCLQVWGKHAGNTSVCFLLSYLQQQACSTSRAAYVCPRHQAPILIHTHTQTHFLT